MSIGETKTVSGVSVTRNANSICVSDIVGTQWIKQQYTGYSTTVAVQMFKRYRRIWRESHR